jgi:hypothetical protein
MPPPGRRWWRRRSGEGPLQLPPQQGPAAVQRRQSRLEVPRYCCRRRQRLQGGRADSGAGKDAALVTNLRDKGTSPSAGFLEDVLVEISERTAELCPKIIRGHGIKFLENRCLVLKCAGTRGVSMKDSDTFDDEGEDVSNCLGGDVWHGLVVR